jgi:hypothetical protein
MGAGMASWWVSLLSEQQEKAFAMTHVQARGCVQPVCQRRYPFLRAVHEAASTSRKAGCRYFAGVSEDEREGNRAVR